MMCVICKHGHTFTGITTVTLERAGITLVFKGVPASICENCGEAYVGEEVTAHLLQQADAAARAGVQVEIRAYAAA